MLNQQTIQRRLKSVQNILNITQAMEVVSGVRFKKVMHKMEHFLFYAEKMANVTAHLLSDQVAEEHPLMQARVVKKRAVFIVSSDKGLCGSYNEHIFSKADAFLKTCDKKNTSLIIFGNKGFEHYKKSPFKIEKKILDYSKHLDEKSIKAWSHDFLDSFQKEDFDELFVVYTHFKNVIFKETRSEKILPLEPPKVKEVKTSVSFIFEPNPKEIYQTLIPLSFYLKIHSILLDSYASELASRLITMKAAAKNAKEMIEELTLLRNKSRQLSITKEILEITAGAEGIR